MKVRAPRYQAASVTTGSQRYIHNIHATRVSVE